MIYFLIALGGAAGSVVRYLIGGAVQRTSASGFPIGTMFVNVSGCFLKVLSPVGPRLPISFRAVRPL